MKKLKKYLPYLYCLLTSFLILALTSKNSFLYGFNDWVDANAFFTVGKSLFNGLVPYRDIFEQKGPFLYLIYGFGYLISKDTFYGVFIIEVLIFSIGLYFLYKTLKLFISSRSSFIILPFFTALLTTSPAFTHGGSAEELSIAFFFITLYYFFKHFKVSPLTKKEMLLNGILAGLVLLIKYTLLGFYFGFTLALFIDYLLAKDYKKAIIYPLLILLGMFIPLGITLIYFGINHGIKDFIDVYFITNITAYQGAKMSLAAKFWSLLKGFLESLKSNGLMLPIILALPLLIFTLPLSKRAKILFIVMFFFTILGTYFGLKFYKYYLLFILFFSSVTYLGLFRFLDKPLVSLPNKVATLFIAGTFLICLFISYRGANYKELIGTKKQDYFQYQFAEILKTKENPTIVNIGYLDSGIYTASGLLPSTYFFEKQNISYEYFPDNLDAFKSYIANRTTSYILYYTKKNSEELQASEPLLYTNYQLIASADSKFENSNYKAYLFEVKES